jgi:predicted nucleotidyltransferase
MVTVGIICEYNPFHNGHIYHINKVKELFPDSRIVLVMSGNFLQRGDVSLINKWDKTEIALDHGIDLVVELPFVFATQSADKFAHGAIQILDSLNVDKLVFGSECNDIDLLKELANTQINNKVFNSLVKKYISDGVSYPSAMGMALRDLNGKVITDPNDILGLCYIKEIIACNSNIEPICIKRTSDYHSNQLDNICSANAIRNAIRNDMDISKFVPSDSLDFININCFIDRYYSFFRYKVFTCNDLCKYVTVDEGLKYRIIKSINSCNDLVSLINCVKTKRYTYNRIKRMFLHILCDFTEEENILCSDIHYIRVLGFNDSGRIYLNSIKKKCELPIISNFSNISDIMLDIEFRSTCVYSLIFDDSSSIIKSEYTKGPIIK